MTAQQVEHRRAEIAEAVKRLVALACDESKTEPETADQYYLLVAVSELEKWAASLTPAVLSLEVARRKLDMVFMWRDRQTDENKVEYRKAVDALVVAALAGASPPEPSALARKIALDATMAGLGLDEVLEAAYAVDGGRFPPMSDPGQTLLAVLHQLEQGEASEGDGRDLAWCCRELRSLLAPSSAPPTGETHAKQ